MVGLLPCARPYPKRPRGGRRDRVREDAAERDAPAGAALKWAGLTALMISCALLVYLGGVLLARLSAWVLFP